MNGRKDIISREIDQAEREMLAEKYKTALKKVQFANDIKNGLGLKIKANPNKARIIKHSWIKRFLLSLKKIFTKF